MTKEQIDFFRFGYSECCRVLIWDLKETVVLGSENCVEIQGLINRLELDEEEDHWKIILEEQPGITRKEYERQLDETAIEIREKYCHKNGHLNLHLLKEVNCGTTGI